ncbi:hypothetical protein QE152_g10182 [Popillia japonica]|uniref:Uncharacterized protein n=1 Tax=Popillia japonica TaxID=7064 RepID=A0AAW1LX51_POPJA
MGGSDDHPHPLDFRHRLRWYLLGKHATTVFTNNTNTEDTDEQCLLSSLETVDAEDGAECGNDTCLTESLMPWNLSLRFVIIEDIDEEPAKDFCFIEPEYPVLALPENTNIASRNLGTLTQFEAQQKINDEALIYIAGYVAFKFKHVAFKFKHKYNLGEPWKNLTIPHKYEWLSYICRRGLMIPNNDVVKVMKIMEQVFYEMHGAFLSDGARNTCSKH